ncbi:MAG: hypothetical protein ACLFSQ_04360 [Candidatus Zixiibacteriota bacterium]
MVEILDKIKKHKIKKIFFKARQTSYYTKYIGILREKYPNIEFPIGKTDNALFRIVILFRLKHMLYMALKEMICSSSIFPMPME